MKRVEREKVAMFIRVIALIEARTTSVFDDLPGFMDFYVPLRDSMTVLSKNSGNQMASLAGVAKKKASVKAELVAMGHELSVRLVAYGASIKSTVLMVTAHYAKTSLEQISSFKTYDRCRVLLKMGQELEGAGAGFGITDGFLEALDVLCERYHALIPSTKTSIIKRCSYTKEIGKLIKENMVLLGSMDILVALLQRDSPDDYYKYFGVRKVIRIGFRKLSVKLKVVDAGGDGLGKVTVVCKALELKKLTYKQGGLNLKRIKNGIYEFEFLKAGYVSEAVTVVISKGERKDLKVVLKRV